MSLSISILISIFSKRVVISITCWRGRVCSPFGLPYWYRYFQQWRCQYQYFQKICFVISIACWRGRGSQVAHVLDEFGESDEKDELDESDELDELETCLRGQGCPGRPPLPSGSLGSPPQTSQSPVREALYLYLYLYLYQYFLKALLLGHLSHL